MINAGVIHNSEIKLVPPHNTPLLDLWWSSGPIIF